MNPYQLFCVCEICGNEGYAHAREAPYLYQSAFVCVDRLACAQNLARKKKVADAAKEVRGSSASNE